MRCNAGIAIANVVVTSSSCDLRPPLPGPAVGRNRCAPAAFPGASRAQHRATRTAAERHFRFRPATQLRSVQTRRALRDVQLKPLLAELDCARHDEQHNQPLARSAWNKSALPSATYGRIRTTTSEQRAAMELDVQ